mgnify:CR=1 FL=1
MKESPIIIENLSKWYGDVRGISGINLEIDKGITGLVGPNASGKTTLLNLICGLLIPSYGKVKIFGEEAFTGTNFKQHLGVAGQKESLYPFMTVLEFVTKFTQLQGFLKHDARKRAQKAIEQVRLTKKIDKKIYTLSKGMRQCLKIAQAIAHDPKILLLDEILNGCDPLVKHYIKNLLIEMEEKNTLILLSSHNLKEMESLTEKVAVIDRGKLVAHGKINELQEFLEKDNHWVSIEGSNIRKLGQILLSYPDVVEIKFVTEDSLQVKTKDPIKFYKRFPSIICSKEHFDIKKIVPTNQNLQALFQNLTGVFN